MTGDIEKGFHFNTAISGIMELVNEIYACMDRKDTAGPALTESVKTVVRLLSPFVPHIAEELWEKLGGKQSLLKTNWPAFDKNLIVEEVITIPVQINGKLRSKISVAPGTSREQLEKKALSEAKVQNQLEGLTIRRWIIIPDKLINIVAAKK